VVKTRAEVFAEQAQEAFRRGRDLLDAGQPDEALRWIERARRFAPEDTTLRYALGLAWLRLSEPGRAAPLLEAVARDCDAREAWLALASARARLGQAEPAAAALRELLSRHVLPDDPGFFPLADDIAQAAGAPGWCGRRHDGGIAATVGTSIAATLDGRRLAPRRLAAPPVSGLLALSAGGRELLGSPLDLSVFGRVEGFVGARDGGLEGWAWHPADPDRPPELTVRSAAGAAVFKLIAEDTAMQALRPLARPRRFTVPAARLRGVTGLLEVAGIDGRALTGSPLDPALRRAAVAPVGIAFARSEPRRAVAVVVPVHGGERLTLDCLDSVFANSLPGTTLVVVDDATPEAGLTRALDALAAQGRIVLLRNPSNRGFPTSANAGLRAVRALRGGPDAVLLNSDTLVPPGWLEGLRAAVHASGDIGTATPLSNDAAILSYPDAGRANPAPDAPALRSLAALAARVCRGSVVDIPTAVGFCMYIRRECLNATGLFREDAFAQGYGEENDFCRRASRLGWRHVAVPGVYVAHVGGASFGGARSLLLARNLAVLEQLHPGYRDLVAAHGRADPLAGARRRLDAARFRAAARPGAAAVLLVTHDSGGGVERVVRVRCDALRAEGKRPIVLRPVRTIDDERTYLPGLCLVCDGTARGTPNLRFALPAELPALLRLLRAARPEAMEVHSLLGHQHAIMELPARLGIPYEVHVHDYAWLCPRITLLGPSRRYCGEPAAVAACEACIAEAGSNTEEAIGIAALQARSAAELAAACRVVTPSVDAAVRLRRHFPALAPVALAHTDDAALPARARPPAGTVTRVCVVGGIGPEKGYDVLLACARDAAERALPLQFVLVGHTPDDAALLATGRVFVTGPYEEAEAVEEIRAQRAHLGFLPSVWPETWCFALGEAWQAGLDVAVFDIGAQAERVRRTHRGWVLPLGLPIAAVNNALLAVRPRAGHE
jgi:GT2 family glycosyltransferase/glycosyltransferase involved in cell wall biosynthesis